MPKTKARKCMFCRNKHLSRGLCKRCLSVAHGKIDRGEVTEAELIRDGYMLPLQKQGRPRGSKSGFAKAFSKSQRS